MKRTAEIVIVTLAGCVLVLVLFAGSPLFPFNILAVSNYSNCKEVQPGMTLPDVRKIMGNPDHTGTWNDRPAELLFSYDRVSWLFSSSAISIFLEIPEYSADIQYSEIDYLVNYASCEDTG